MKRQKLIGDTEPSSFIEAVNKDLKEGWNIVPGCLYATAMHSMDDHFFSITLWKDGVQKLLGSPNFHAFVNHVNSYLDIGYYVVVGSLYAAGQGRNDQKPESDFTEQFFFNVIGEN